MLVNQNTVNIRSLNDMNKTALYYASSKRNRKFGWNEEVSSVVDYKQLSKLDRTMKKDKDY